MPTQTKQVAEQLKRRLLRIKNSRQMNMVDLSALDYNTIAALNDAISTLEQENIRLKKRAVNHRF